MQAIWKQPCKQTLQTRATSKRYNYSVLIAVSLLKVPVTADLLSTIEPSVPIGELSTFVGARHVFPISHSRKPEMVEQKERVTRTPYRTSKSLLSIGIRLLRFRGVVHDHEHRLVAVTLQTGVVLPSSQMDAQLLQSLHRPRHLCTQILLITQRASALLALHLRLQGPRWFLYRAGSASPFRLDSCQCRRQLVPVDSYDQTINVNRTINPSSKLDPTNSTRSNKLTFALTFTDTWLPSFAFL